MKVKIDIKDKGLEKTIKSVLYNNGDVVVQTDPEIEISDSPVKDSSHIVVVLSDEFLKDLPERNVCYSTESLNFGELERVLERSAFNKSDAGFVTMVNGPNKWRIDNAESVYISTMEKLSTPEWGTCKGTSEIFYDLRTLIRCSIILAIDDHEDPVIHIEKACDRLLGNIARNTCFKDAEIMGTYFVNEADVYKTASKYLPKVVILDQMHQVTLKEEQKQDFECSARIIFANGPRTQEVINAQLQIAADCLNISVEETGLDLDPVLVNAYEFFQFPNCKIRDGRGRYHTSEDTIYPTWVDPKISFSQFQSECEYMKREMSTDEEGNTW